MATGGSLEISSDQDNGEHKEESVNIIYCSYCLLEEQYKVAIKFCVECSESLCEDCLKHHNKFPSTKNHKLEDCLDKDESHYEGQKMAIVKTMCSNHPGKYTDMFCNDHEIVCCAVCIALDHRSCTKVDYILEIENAMKVMQGQLGDMKKTRENDLKTLKDRKQEMLVKVNSFRNELISKVNKLANKSEEDIELKYEEPTADIEKDITAMANMMTKLETKGNEIQNITVEQNEDQVVNHMTTSIVNKSKGFQLLTDIRSHHRKQTTAPDFKKDLDIDTSLTEMNLIGEVISGKSYYQYAASYQSQNELKTGIYYRSGSQVKIFCSCQFPNGNILIASKPNMTLSYSDNTMIGLIDSSYEHICYCFSRHKEPCGICTVNSTKAALTFPQNRKVQYVTIVNEDKTKIELGETFNVQSECRGIAFSNNRLYVGCGGGGGRYEDTGHIRVYDLSGTLLRTLLTDPHGQQLTLFPRNMVINKAGTKLFIANGEHGACIIKIHSLEKSQFHDSSLKEINGICLRNDMDIFACGTMADGKGSIVAIVDRKFRNITDEEFSDIPNTVLIDKVNSRLVVDNSKGLRVFDLERKLF